MKMNVLILTGIIMVLLFVSSGCKTPRGLCNYDDEGLCKMPKYILFPMCKPIYDNNGTFEECVPREYFRKS